MMSAFDVLVLDRFLSRRPRAAAAAARAGGIGIVDVEFNNTPRIAAQAARHVQWLRDRATDDAAIGLRLAPASIDAWSDALEAIGPRGVVILAGRADGASIAAARGAGRRVLIEVRSWADYDASASLDAAIDGVIACGNESGGRVGADTTLVLLQRLIQDGRLPVYARGGLGVLGAAGCRAAGARGVVLDDQLLLLADASLSRAQQELLTGVSGLDTLVVSNGTVDVRVLDRPAFGGAAELKQRTRAVERGECAPDEWLRTAHAVIGWGDAAVSAWPVGQAVQFADAWRARYRTTAAAVRAVLVESDRFVRQARENPAIVAGSALAASHGTEFPIVQGPMTRVSDTPAFALQVAEAGALPMIALAVLPGPQAESLLDATSALLGDRPWGVGILGFVPPDLRHAQIAAILRARPGFALIAGGRPDEAAPLEAAGISTYLHVPAPTLLRRFMAQGAKRFIFEGRECGGHVGPLCSMALWESMIDTLLAAPGDLHDVHVLFAGGIHDRRSGAVVSAMAAPLVERGIKIGVLMGTAYLFTEEAVSSGAITARYQAEALACRSTVLLASGLGHANRVAETPFTAEFNKRRAELLKEGRAADSVREELENLTLGRLRLASKGLVRDERGLVPASDQEQASGGIYMLGQVATLRSRACRMIELHRDVCDAPRPAGRIRGRGEIASADVAIIGVSMLVPGASHHEGFWRNALDLVNCIREVPADRWDARLIYDADKNARDRTYSRWGGYCDDIRFEPMGYRIPPAAMPQICSNQLLGLELTRRAIADAGYDKRPFDREHAAVVFGISETGGWNGNRLIMRSFLPFFVDGAVAPAESRLPEWTGESFTGMLANITAGRVANAFDLGGPNFVLDAACASSIYAVDLAVRELESGRSNVALVGAIDTSQTPFSYLAFAKTQALSPTGQARVFDRSADGIVLSEGGVVMMLKRYDDARRDGDRIYAVIRGTATGSDGHGLGLTAPKVDGQRRVVQRALYAAGVPAASLGLLEAHATGTPLGDRTEAETLNSVLRDSHAEPGATVVGSVKSLIGHTKAVAGLVGMAKTAMALRHRVLPPHGGVSQPADTLAAPDSRLALLQAPRPWLTSASTPRRAGVSAFGFGGTNGVVVLEEDSGPSAHAHGADVWPAELFVFRAGSSADVGTEVRELRTALEEGAEPRLRDLAFALALKAERATGDARGAVVASSRTELIERLRELQSALNGSLTTLPSYLSAGVVDGTGSKLAIVFPGQGSQYPGMARDHALYFPEVRASLELADAITRRGTSSLTAVIYPAGAFGGDAARQQQAALAQSDRAQPAIGAISTGIADLLDRCGVEADAVAGHSYGELVALHAAGVLTRHDLMSLSLVRGQLMSKCDEGGMISVAAPRDAVSAAVAKIDGITIANHNGPAQTVLSGSIQALTAAAEALDAAGWRPTRLPVSGAFHSPLMAAAAAPWKEALQSTPLSAPDRDAYGNRDGSPYTADAGETRERIAAHLLSSVEFVAQIERMYADGVRTFVEAGPGQVVTRLVSAILGERPFVAIATDPASGRLTGFLGTLGALFVQGRLPSPSRLFDDRDVTAIALDELAVMRPAPPTATTWWVNPLTVRPHDARVAANVQPLLTAETRSAAPPSPVSPAPAPRLPNMPMPSLPLSPARSSSEMVAAYAAYQETMRRFLEVQERVMAAVLGGAPMPLPQAGAPLTTPAPLPPQPDRAMAEAPAPEVPIAAAPASAPAAPPERVQTLDAPAIETLLVKAASVETGYPAEMLGRELDLTGDLGIDSLRHVQIVTAVAEALPADVRERLSGHMDRLLAARTLNELTTVLVNAVGPDRSASAAPSAPVNRQPEPVAAASCERSAPRGFARPLELPERPARWHHVVITEDTMGIAPLIAGVLSASGARVTLIRRADLSSSTGVAAACAGCADADAVVHLAALDGTDSADAPQVAAKSLLHLLRALPENASPKILAASLMGGSFGRDGHVGPGSPLGGAAVGVLRAMAAERAGLRVKAVDFSAADDKQAIAGRLVQELGAQDDAVEVGYRASGRAVFLNVPCALAAEKSPDAVEPSPDWVVLATGGARGITAGLLSAIVKRGMTVVLAGRRPLPGPEAAGAAGLDDAALRQWLVQRARAEGERPTPAAIEAKLKALLHDREIRDTMAALAAAGVNVEYHACDVRDAGAFETLVRGVYDRHGRIDAVLHGAGVIDDHLLHDKTDESIDRVFDTKVAGAQVLARVLRHDRLRLMVLFGSVAGRTGSAGQSDYAAANEVLNRVAWSMAGQWRSTRVLSINWGPWSGIGMATPAVQAALRARGIISITPPQGLAFFLDELQRGSRLDVEVIAGTGPWSAAPPPEPPATADHEGLRISRA